MGEPKARNTLSNRSIQCNIYKFIHQELVAQTKASQREEQIFSQCLEEYRLIMSFSCLKTQKKKKAGKKEKYVRESLCSLLSLKHLTL